MPSVSSEINVEKNGRVEHIRGGHPQAQTRCIKPMVNSGSLERYTHQDLTPVIGREFKGLQVRDLLKGDAQLIQDLAVTSQSQCSKLSTLLRCVSI